MAIAIRVENLSKAYQLGEIGTGTLSRDLERWFAKVRGKEDPFLKIGETNDRTSKSTSNIVWSLKDINFDIQEGDAVGIIGRNGAGKSTLLKLLSRVTSPTSGNIKVKGRIASLLEVGTGFHPELTGRENIYLNGAILGMRKKEIKRKFDEIVHFAGVERYIDTPVKRYSSGMYVRLAFAVAAHLESEILIVDEVLAVGDAEFQKKCIGKMGEVSKGEGRTVLFVSHNMTAVKQLCNSGIVLHNGSICFKGSQYESIKFYQNSSSTLSNFKHLGSITDAPGNENIRILFFKVRPLYGEALSISSGFEFELHFYNSQENINLAATFELRSTDENVVFHHGTYLCRNNDAKKGVYVIKGKIEPHTLNAGIYKFCLIFGASLQHLLLQISDLIQFEIMNEILEGNLNVMPGLLRPIIPYQVSFNEYETLPVKAEAIV